MTPTEAAAAMRAILNRNESVDEEATHIQADSLMCEVLTALGYGEMVAAFQDMTRWYS